MQVFGLIKINKLTFVIIFLIISTSLLAQNSSSQKIDADYTAKIIEYTTEPFFLTSYVDHLPASDTVPTPKDVLGTIAGAPNVLHHSDEINGYLRQVGEASPRVQIIPMGTSAEGRSRVLAVISSAETISNLETAKALTARLADPRGLSEQEAEGLIAKVKPIYHLTGGQHSSETGSPEMLMELVYRLAVSEAAPIRNIRENMIVLVTAVMELDGRDKQVDLHMARHKDKDINLPERLLYWGKYVAHDNNRDGLGLQLEMSRSAFDVLLSFHPQVYHDLHESTKYFYASTGTGPYNPFVDPIQIDEWNTLAYTEVSELTRRGVPGVYTHGFWDGWGIAGLNNAVNVHNAIGRFYEIQGAANGSDHIVTSDEKRSWYKPNPPLREVVFSLRNNVNLSQSGVLIALDHMASNRTTYMRNFYLKSKHSTEKAYTEGPAAYVLSADDVRPGQQVMLLDNLKRQGVEVHRTTKRAKIGDISYPRGSYVIRMDQPYSRAADILLDKQYYNPSDNRPSDAVGWTMGPLYNTTVDRVTDTAILKVNMELIDGDIRVTGGLVGKASTAYIINNNAEVNLANFRFANPDLKISIAEKDFTAASKKFNAGSYIIKAADNEANLSANLEQQLNRFGLTAYSVRKVPNVETHDLAAPRVALMHTWTSTQTEGWIRVAFDHLGIPFDYISVHDVRDDPNLKSKYDVILFGPDGGNALSVLRGVTGDNPIPWQKSALTPSHGVQDQSDDIRGGLEISGALNIQNFVMAGGLFIAIGSSAELPVHFAMTDNASIRQAKKLWAGNGVFRTQIVGGDSPITYGYGEELGVSFKGTTLFGNKPPVRRRFGAAPVAARDDGQGATTDRPSGRGGADEQDVIQGRPKDMGKAKVLAFKEAQEKNSDTTKEDSNNDAKQTGSRTLISFHKNADQVLISGGLKHGEELAGTPALIDAPLGKGHIVLFNFDPFYRAFSAGSFALVFNAMLNFDNL